MNDPDGLDPQPLSSLRARNARPYAGSIEGVFAMKERRKSGATHSFRLTREAAEIVDNINHPRRLGGKSRKISDAIEWYFTRQDEQESVADLKASRIWWMEQHKALKNSQSEANTPPWWRRLWPF